MYSMVLMAALTTGTDMPDMGRRGGRGCCGGGMGMCYGGWGGGCWGGGMGWGGCYGGMGYGGMGYGGCYGGGWGGGCYGGMRYGGWGGGCYGGGYVLGGGYGGNYVLGGGSPGIGYAMTPMTYGSGVPIAGNTTLMNPGTQSFYFNPGMGNQANEATIVVHLPADATLTIDGQATQSRSGTRTFTSPPLQPGRTYTYTLQAELNRDGRTVKAQRTIDVQAGRQSEVDLTSLGNNNNRDD